jgi:hypothetical protein
MVSGAIRPVPAWLSAVGVGVAARCPAAVFTEFGAWRRMPSKTEPVVGKEVDRWM